MNRTIKIIGCLLIVAAIGFGYAGYFVISQDPATGITSDGLGRTLTDSPRFMRLIFGEEKLWAGWGRFILDMVIIWGTMGIAIYLIWLPGKGSKRDNAFEYDMAAFEDEED